MKIKQICLSVVMLLSFVFNDSQALAWAQVPPWLLNPCCSNVLFIPGLEASRLYTTATSSEEQIWEPALTTIISKLYLDQEGKSINPNIYTRDILDESVPFDIYKKFDGYMAGLVTSGTIEGWKAFPYDWRQFQQDVLTNGALNSDGHTDRLVFAQDELQKLAATSKTGKVTIVAHSNGGLIAKLLVQYLEQHGLANLVDRVILVAVPQIGTPKAVGAILNGYDGQIGGGLFLSQSTSRKLGLNMPSVYGLLPSNKYFQQVSDVPVEFDSSLDGVSNLHSIFGTTTDSLTNLQDFMTAKKDNRAQPSKDEVEHPAVGNYELLVKADNLHSVIDEYSFPSSIKVFQIIGWGLDTMKAIQYYGKTVCIGGVVGCKKDVDYKPVYTTDGDGTVVSPSAGYLPVTSYYINLANYNRYWQDSWHNRNHADILEVDPVENLIGLILQDKNIQASIPEFTTESKPSSDKVNKIHLSVHSPVSIDVYDSTGRHTGVATSSEDVVMADQEIPNSHYETTGEDQYVTLDDKDNYHIVIKGTGYGTFTLQSDRDLGGTTTSANFLDIPVSPLSEASLDISGSTTTIQTLQLDSDGDAQVDFQLKPETPFDPILYLEQSKKLIATLGLKTKVQDEIFMKINKLEKFINAGKIKNVEKNIRKYVYRLNKQKANHNRIDTADKDAILSLLNTLLNELTS